MPTVEAQRKAFKWVLERTPSPGRGAYKANAMNRWIARVQLDIDGCWIWQGTTSGSARRPSLHWTNGGRQINRSATWFMFDHWFPGVVQVTLRRTRPRCGKRMCVSPLCHRVLDGRDMHVTHRVLTPAKILEIRNTPLSVTDRQIGASYGVTERTVSDIRLGRTWRWVGGPMGRRRPQQHRLTERDVREMLDLKGHKPASEVGPAYGVTPRTVYSIWNGHRWAGVYAAYHAENGA